MSRLTLGVLAIGLLLFASPASAYVWRCHTPNGDVWTSQPPQSGNCEEYDGTFNPNAAPQAAPPEQYPPQYAPAPGICVSLSLSVPGAVPILSLSAQILWRTWGIPGAATVCF